MLCVCFGARRRGAPWTCVHALHDWQRVSSSLDGRLVSAPTASQVAGKNQCTGFPQRHTDSMNAHNVCGHIRACILTYACVRGTPTTHIIDNRQQRQATEEGAAGHCPRRTRCADGTGGAVHAAPVQDGAHGGAQRHHQGEWVCWSTHIHTHRERAVCLCRVLQKEALRLWLTHRRPRRVQCGVADERGWLSLCWMIWFYRY